MAQTDAPDAGIDGDINLDRDPEDYQPRRRARQPRPPVDAPPTRDGATDDDRPTWTDPRFLVPLGLFLAAVFVIGLALRAGSIQPGSTSAQELVDRVVSAEQRAGFSDITVRAEDSLIVLIGSAESTTDAIAMGAVARSVEGVRSVDNRLVIVGGALEEQVTSSTLPPVQTETLSGQLAAAGNVTFEPGSAALTAEGTATVNRVAELLLAAPSVQIEVHGHTDSDGDEAANQVLSQERAAAVVEALTIRGVDARTLTPVGFGESHPIEPNITDEGRATNRRIEFKVLPG